MTSSTNPTHPKAAPLDDGGDAAAGRVVLVAHDFSECADAAADLALDDLLDSRSGGRLLLTHAFLVMLPPSVMDPVPMTETYMTIENSTRVEATRRLERVAERLRARQKERFAGPPPVEIEVTVRMGTAADALIEEAKARAASRIYVGTHGRKGLSHLVLGSVAERVVRHAPIPVVVAHAHALAKEGGAP